MLTIFVTFLDVINDETERLEKVYSESVTVKESIKKLARKLLNTEARENLLKITDEKYEYESEDNFYTISLARAQCTCI